MKQLTDCEVFQYLALNNDAYRPLNGGFRDRIGRFQARNASTKWVFRRVEVAGGDQWIAEDMLCIVDGSAYGLDEQGKTFCVGPAAMVEALLRGESIDESADGFWTEDRIRRNLARSGIAPTSRADEAAASRSARAGAAVLRGKPYHATVRPPSGSRVYPGSPNPARRAPAGGR